MGRKEDISNSIINASIDEMLVKGLDMSSMESIAKKADVSKRTLYKYFANKDIIFDTITKNLLDTFCNFELPSYEPGLAIGSQINAIISRKVELLTYPGYMKTSKLVLSELIKGRAINEEHFAKFMESEMRFINWIDQAKTDGQIKSQLDSQLIAKQFHSLIKGQIFYPVLFGFEELTEESIGHAKDSAKSFFLNSFC
ncbi:MAG: hypothetical protein BM556_14875 [Bacteriovorax sp. MedPE-SWde]|nr:MAG: hypothetical protein BM556_14875 [Bacteriovorax sp. MedPE-SWde]